jgi:hypothetical protein
VKPSSVRGTPVRSMSGTSPSQYVGDQSQQPNRASGTPYNSSKGNSATAKTVKQSGGVGQVIDTQTGVMFHEPNSNGNGVVFDGITREGDYFPAGAPAMDSPVPNGAATMPKGAMRAENIAHLGSGTGVNASQAGDVLLAIGGVMSRGMVGTSTPAGGEAELTKDDTL